MVSKYQFALNSLLSQLDENLSEQKELKHEAVTLRKQILDVKNAIREEKTNA